MKYLAIFLFLAFLVSATISRAGYRLKIEGQVVKVEDGKVHMKNQHGSAVIPLSVLPKDVQQTISNSEGKSKVISFHLNPELL